jgi:hypothetical protein
VLDYHRLEFHQGGIMYEMNGTGARMEYSFNPKLYCVLFGQWNSEFDRFILNFRLSWIPVVGSDVYLADQSGFGH